MKRLRLCAAVFAVWWIVAGILRIAGVIHFRPEWQLWLIVAVPSIELFGLTWGLLWSIDWPNQNWRKRPTLKGPR